MRQPTRNWPETVATAVLVAGLTMLAFPQFARLRAQHDAQPRPPEPPLPAGELVYVCTDNFDIDVFRPDGSYVRRLRVRGLGLDVAADGRLLYLRNDRDVPVLYVSTAEGNDEREVARNLGAARWLDARTIVGVWSRPGDPGSGRSLQAVDVATGRPRKLFDAPAVAGRKYAGAPTPSPDGRRLLTDPETRVWSPTTDLFICDLDGRNVHVVWQDPPDEDRLTCDCRPLWLPGDLIVWCRYATTGAQDAIVQVRDTAVVALKLGEKRLHALTDWKGFKYPLCASPDHQRLLFMRAITPQASAMEMWVMDLDGSNQRRFLAKEFAGVWGVMSACWVRVPPSP